MSLAAGLRDLLDRARVEFAGHPAIDAIEADFTALHEAVTAGDPAADATALDVVKRLYQPPPAPPKPAAKAEPDGAAVKAAAPAVPAPKPASPA